MPQEMARGTRERREEEKIMKPKKRDKKEQNQNGLEGQENTNAFSHLPSPAIASTPVLFPLLAGINPAAGLPVWVMRHQVCLRNVHIIVIGILGR